MAIEGFIRASSRSDSTQELFEGFREAMAALGFDYVLFSLLTAHPSLELPAGHGLMHGFPDAWTAFFIRDDGEVIDPLRRKVFLSDDVFSWNSAMEGYPLPKKDVPRLLRAQKAGLHEVIGIPLRGPHGALACAIAASEKPQDKIWRMEARPRSFLLAQQFYRHFRRLEEKMPLQQIIVWLSTHERAVLEWCAKGKTREEISDILCISPSTVKFHIQRAQDKLATANKTAAALKAMQQGLIRAA